MKLSHVIFGTALSLGMAITPVYAKDTTNSTKLSAAEQSTLATIATIDVAEILIGEVALNKKNTSEVTDLAKMMIEQHSSNLAQILTMAGNSNVKLPLAEGEAGKLATEGKKNMMALGALKGEQFDKAYANAMVTGHEGALKLIDTKLMKTAKSEEMKKFLTDTRTVVAEHLEHAKKVQAELKA